MNCVDVDLEMEAFTLEHENSLLRSLRLHRGELKERFKDYKDNTQEDLPQAKEGCASSVERRSSS
jgi:hypothetical protein